MSDGTTVINSAENENDNFIPQGWKAVVLFTVYSFAILCTAGVIVGYGQLYPTLIASKVFYNLCNDSIATFDAPFNHTCEKQDAALGKMFNLAASMNIFVQAFGGVLLDFAGPKLTFMLAMVLLLPGTILFAFSSADFNYYFLRYVSCFTFFIYIINPFSFLVFNLLLLVVRWSSFLQWIPCAFSLKLLDY
jgi:hypothetical protein